jgi:hypothetical protein
MSKFTSWLKDLCIRIVKTMAETALAVIGTGAFGILDVDWLSLLSACALSGVITILFNLSSLKTK